MAVTDAVITYWHHWCIQWPQLIPCILQHDGNWYLPNSCFCSTLYCCVLLIDVIRAWPRLTTLKVNHCWFSVTSSRLTSCCVAFRTVAEFVDCVSTRCGSESVSSSGGSVPTMNVAMNVLSNGTATLKSSTTLPPCGNPLASSNLSRTVLDVSSTSADVLAASSSLW